MAWDSWDSGGQILQISPGLMECPQHSAAGGPSSCVRDFGDTSHDSHDSHDTAIVFQIVSKAGDDFHLKGPVGCRTPAERKKNGCTARALEVTNTFCLRDVRDVIKTLRT